MSHVTQGGDTHSGWDFFISYTQADRAWAEWIAWVLEEDGYQVLVQAWDFVPGSNWVQRMQAGTRDAERTIAVLSDDYLASVYGSTEWQAAWASDPSGTGRKLLIVRVMACNRPGLLAGVVGVDLFGLAEDLARAQLRSIVTAAQAGRAKPSIPPRFPSATRAMPREPSFPGKMPQVWNVPACNPNFIGRVLEQDSVWQDLHGRSRVTVHSVHGLGGVGKSQLAIEYAYGHAEDYDVVWWIAAEQPASIPGQFATLAVQLGLDPVANPAGLRAQIHNQLRGVQGWLLIFDNANSTGDIQPWLPTSPQSVENPGHVIVTTRRGGFAAIGQVLDLDVIGVADAVLLLRSRVPALSQQNGEQIAEELGRLPLALEQAAAYMDRAQLPGQEYLELLHNRASDLYSRGRVATREETIATLWDVSVERVNSESQAAVQLLGVCSYLAPEPIPLDLFTTYSGLLPEPLSAAAADQLTFIDTIAVLVNYSLVKRTFSGLQIHRLVQATIRARHPRSHPSPLRHTSEGIPPLIGWRSPVATALALLKEAAPPTIVGVPSEWPQWETLLPHVLAATSHYNDTLPAIGRETSYLLARAACYLRVRGQPRSARPVAERALVIAEDTYPPDDLVVAARLSDLALILLDLGRPADAKPLLERALEIDDVSGGPTHHSAAAGDMSNLALVLRELGQSESARSVAEHALAIDEDIYGQSHPAVAADLGNLALVLRDLGRATEAIPLLERALAIAEAAHGPNHPEVAIRLDNLAGALRDVGEPTAAREAAERALAIDEVAYGPDHPDIATDLSNIALAMRDMGKSAAARPLAERALAIDEAAYGPNHPTVATRVSNLAAVLQDMGEPEAAQPLAERAVAIAEAAYGPAHPTVGTFLSNLALIMANQGNSAAAQPLLDRALAIVEVAYGPDHPEVAAALNNVALAMRDMGESAAARPLAERALAIDEAAYGPNHPTVATRVSNLAAVLQDMEEPEAAQPLAERAVAIAEAAYGPAHPTVGTFLSNLALIMANQGNSAAAQRHLERASVITKATLSINDLTAMRRTSESNLASIRASRPRRATRRGDRGGR